MLTFNTTLKNQLLAASNKLNWSGLINTALGASRRVRVKRDAAANAADAWTTGTEFLNSGATGPIVVQGGNITNLGVLSGTTISVDAPVNSGTCVLRIEGNGSFVQGTFGPSRATQLASGVLLANVVKYDFVLNANSFVGTQGVALTEVRIAAPKPLPSGTGPLAPPRSADRPYQIDLEDWTNPAAPTLVGSLVFNTRIEDWVFEDAEYAASMGDIRVTQSSDMITYRRFEFGATLLSINNAANSVPGETMYEVMVAIKPTAANWPDYPTTGGYIPASTTTHPKAFKLFMRKENGAMIHTWDMPRDNLAVNDGTLSQVLSVTQPDRKSVV